MAAQSATGRRFPPVVQRCQIRMRPRIFSRRLGPGTYDLFLTSRVSVFLRERSLLTNQHAHSEAEGVCRGKRTRERRMWASEPPVARRADALRKVRRSFGISWNLFPAHQMANTSFALSGGKATLIWGSIPHENTLRCLERQGGQ